MLESMFIFTLYNYVFLNCISFSFFDRSYGVIARSAMCCKSCVISTQNFGWRLLELVYHDRASWL